MKLLNELYGKHKEDVYILGSGSSLAFIDKSFFEGKITIGLNMVYRDFNVSYMLSHHHNVVQEAINCGQTVITSEWGTCAEVNGRHNFEGEYYVYKHTWQGYSEVDLSRFGEIIGAAGTPVVAALQVAYLMGAKNIILCGVDGGSIDGKYNYKDYYIPTADGHAGRVENVIREVANRIRKEGVGVHSLNPFVNFTNEDHNFVACNSLWNDSNLDT